MGYNLGPPSYYIFSKSAILWSPLSISLEILDFRNPTMLIKHYRDDHGSFPPIFENKPKFICSHCSNIYISEKSLKAHAFTAHSKKPKRTGPKILVQCSFCEKTYGTKQRLRDHVIMEHENSAKYECGVCHRKLPTAGKLKDHMKQV